MESGGTEGITGEFPGTVLADIKKFAMIYGIYVNPYTGYIYATDAADYASGGLLYQWSPEGVFMGRHSVYINPAHFLALKPDSWSGVADIIDDARVGNGMIYNLQGLPVANPMPGHIYIRDGKKFICR